MLFHRQSCTASCCEAVKYQPTAPPPVLKEPQVKQAAVRSPYAQRDIAKEHLSIVGRADDFRWIIGQLFYIHADGGLWVVRYAPLDKEDRFGGSVVLAAATSMEGFQEGDLVTVHGEILSEERASKFLGGPLYRANAVNLNQRAPR
jgi:hypothetical protein